MTEQCKLCGSQGVEQYCARPRCPAHVESENRRLHAGPPPTYYTTPPDFKNCMNYQEHGPTPCWHPHCNCFETRRDWARDWPPHSYPDPWKSSRSEIIPPMIGLALVLGGLLAAILFLR